MNNHLWIALTCTVLITTVGILGKQPEIISPVGVMPVSVAVEPMVGTPTPKWPEKPAPWQVVQAIAEEWKDEPVDKIVTAITCFKSESGFRIDAKGYNCYYDKDGNVKAAKTEPTDKSKACKLQDRQYAWSMDHGIPQLHQEPIASMEGQLKRAKEKYDRAGKTFRPWFAKGC